MFRRRSFCSRLGWWWWVHCCGWSWWKYSWRATYSSDLPNNAAACLLSAVWSLYTLDNRSGSTTPTNDWYSCSSRTASLATIFTCILNSLNWGLQYSRPRAQCSSSWDSLQSDEEDEDVREEEDATDLSSPPDNKYLTVVLASFLMCFNSV